MTDSQLLILLSVTSLLTDRRLRSWLSGAVLTTWSSTRSKQWRWSWTSGETPLLFPHTPSWTVLWMQWSHSGSWAPPSLRTWSGTIMRKFNLPQELLKQFYSTIIESVLCTSITVWFSSATKSDLRRLRRVVRTAERIIGTTLPTLQELYSSRVSKRAGKITLDPSHPAHSLFELLPSGRRYRALSTRTTRHRDSFFLQAIHLMNTWH